MVKVIRDKVIEEFIYIACGESEDAADKERTRTRTRARPRTRTRT